MLANSSETMIIHPHQSLVAASSVHYVFVALLHPVWLVLKQEMRFYTGSNVTLMNESTAGTVASVEAVPKLKGKR